MKGRLKFRRPFVVLDKKKTGGENFLKKVFSPRPPLSKTFDVIESLFIAFLILTASGSPPDFFVGKEMLILFARFLRIEAFTPFQSQTKRQDPSFSWGCHFEKTANRDSIRGKVLEGRGEGRGKLSPESFPLPSPGLLFYAIPNMRAALLYRTFSSTSGLKPRVSYSLARSQLS